MRWSEKVKFVISMLSMRMLHQEFFIFMKKNNVSKDRKILNNQLTRFKNVGKHTKILINYNDKFDNSQRVIMVVATLGGMKVLVSNFLIKVKSWIRRTIHKTTAYLTKEKTKGPINRPYKI